MKLDSIIEEEIINESGPEKNLVRLMGVEQFYSQIVKRGILRANEFSTSLYKDKKEIATFRSSSQFSDLKTGHSAYPATLNKRSNNIGMVKLHIKAHIINDKLRGAKVKPISELGKKATDTLKSLNVSKEDEKLLTKFIVNKAKELKYLDLIQKKNDALKKNISQTELDELNYIIKAKQMRLNSAVDDYIKESGIKDRIIYTSYSVDWITVSILQKIAFSTYAKEGEERISFDKSFKGANTKKVPIYLSNRNEPENNYLKIEIVTPELYTSIPSRNKEIIEFMKKNEKIFIKNENYRKSLIFLKELSK